VLLPWTRLRGGDGRVLQSKAVKTQSAHLLSVTELGGCVPLALGVSTVRHLIPERTFDYVFTSRSATAGRRPERLVSESDKKSAL
jgi:hypothetical protein